MTRKLHYLGLTGDTPDTQRQTDQTDEPQTTRSQQPVGDPLSS